MTYQETELQEIKKVTGLAGHVCSCSKCVTMCKTAVCLGTPNDIIKIIEKGFAEKLQLTTNMACMQFGLPPLEMIQPLFDEQKQQCSFLINDRCQLHDLNLKPTEGRLADCRINKAIPGKIPLPAAVHTRWITETHKVAEAFLKYIAVNGKLHIQ